MTKKLGIFCIWFLIYYFSWVILFNLKINSLPLQSEDIIPSIFTGISIVEDKTLYLNNYFEMMTSKYPQPDNKNSTPFYLKKIGDNYLSAFPILSSLVTLPIFFIYLQFVSEISWADIYQLSHLSGAYIMALSSVLFFYLLQTAFKLSDKKSLAITFIYSFATINFSLVSQGLWQHGVVQLFSILGLIFYYKKSYFYMSLFLGFGILARPTAAIVFLILFIFIFINKELRFKNFINIFFGMLLPLLFFILYNQIYYQDISNQGYASQFLDSWIGNFPESFFGIWLSPSKGVLIYSPIIIFSLISIYKGFKKEDFLKISFWVILIHTLVLSKWKHWYGGFGYGYRMISDVIPFLVLPLIYFLENYFLRLRNWFFVTLIISVIIQISGLIFFDSIWHNAYDDGFKNTSWLWSLDNSEAAFNIRRILVKVGLLDRACEGCEPGP
jgi:hypothetical protein